MFTEPSETRRHEWKYRVPPEQAAGLVEAIRHDTEPDPYCAAAVDGAYRVRSLYYDTPDLRFYHETRDGVEVRRKLRVRNYGDDTFFLEIKRKVSERVLKERVALHRSQVSAALDGQDPAVVMAGRPGTHLQTMERFRGAMKSLGLVPAVLIAYHRRAMVGRLEPNLRITLDSQLHRCRPASEDQLFTASALQAFEDHWVLELKFDDWPPRWLARLTTEFQLRRRPYSKYCAGVDGRPYQLDGRRGAGADR